MMGVDEPDYGHLLDDMEVFEDAPVPAGRYLLPAGRGRGRLRARPTTCRARAAPRTTCWPPPPRSRPSIELIDTRITDWKIKLCDTIADNASSAGWVLGEARVSPKDIDIRNIDAVLTRNGEVVAEGRSDAVLGNPVTAVAWLARKVDSFGVRLKAGDIVLPGSCTRAIDATSGRRFRRRLRRARFSPTCRSNRRRHATMAARRHPSRSSGPATSAPTCCTSCCARSGSSRAGWSASTRTARAWRAARKLGLETSARGRRTGCSAQDEMPDLVFEATSAYVHRDARAALRRGRHPGDRPDARPRSGPA